MNNTWIDIVDFANKYGISQSTIRRRIRARAIEYKMEKGKYLLEDNPQNFGQAPLYTRVTHQQSARGLEHGEALSDDFVREMDALRSENRQLRNQIAELQMLVKVLEEQNPGA